MFGFGIGEIVGGVIGVGGAVYGFWKRKQLTTLIKELFEFIRKLRAVRDAKSAGGEKITVEEMDELIKEGEDVLLAAVPLFSRWVEKK